MHPVEYIRTRLLKMTQKELAEAMKCSQGAISKWENGLSQPALDDLAKIRKIATKHGIAWSDSIFFAVPR